jgi:hypothetical protein
LGKNTKRFQLGDEVFGDLGGRWGGFAEAATITQVAMLRSLGYDHALDDATVTVRDLLL